MVFIFYMYEEFFLPVYLIHHLASINHALPILTKVCLVLAKYTGPRFSCIFINSNSARMKGTTILSFVYLFNEELNV